MNFRALHRICSNIPTRAEQPSLNRACEAELTTLPAATEAFGGGNPNPLRYYFCHSKRNVLEKRSLPATFGSSSFLPLLSIFESSSVKRSKNIFNKNRNATLPSQALLLLLLPPSFIFRSLFVRLVFFFCYVLQN